LQLGLNEQSLKEELSAKLTSLIGMKKPIGLSSVEVSESEVDEERN